MGRGGQSSWTMRKRAGLGRGERNEREEREETEERGRRKEEGGGCYVGVEPAIRRAINRSKLIKCPHRLLPV